MIRMNFLKHVAIGLLITGLVACVSPPPPASDPDALFTETPAEGVRWGVHVMTLEGREILSVRADERFIPASNTKLFTTAAAFHYLGDLDVPDAEGSTRLLVQARGEGLAPDLILKGGGDPFLTDFEDCTQTCLHELADAVVAAGIEQVSDVIGDDSLLPAYAWGQGWSWNSFVWYYAAPVSALTINENTLGMRLAPAEDIGAPVIADWLPGDDFLDLENEAVTSAAGTQQTLRIMRVPGGQTVQLTGRVPQNAPARTYALSSPEPAQIAAARLARLLEARGVRIDGEVKGRHAAIPLEEGAFLPVEIARLTPRPVIDSVRRVQKDSQNLHAELLLRKIASARGELSPEGGESVLRHFIIGAGRSPVEIELFDGSGLSTYNRVTPRGVAEFLRWAYGQSWGAQWRETLPQGGVDGTLRRRFRGTPLEGRIFAKTGTLHGVNALSGYMSAASGEMLVFSILANDRPADGRSVIPRMDAALVQIAAEN